MYILTQACQLETCEEKIYRDQSTSLEEMYLSTGYHRYERRYQLKCQHKEYIIQCPEYRKAEYSGLSIVVIPEFLVPRRPYPIYVYLYAIDLYSGNPEKGQRWAAEATRKRFGLQSFAHTTLGRALKALVRNLDAATEITESDGLDSASASTGEKIENNTGQKEAEKESGRGNGNRSKACFPSVRSTEWLRKRAAEFLCGRLGCATMIQIIEAGQAFAMEWYKEYGRFLL